jgi:predicted O-methyltransferase YrrM
MTGARPPSGRYRRAPGLKLAWSDEDPGALLVERDGGRLGFRVGPRALALLDAFGTGGEVEAVLDALVPRGAGDEETDSWLGACFRLVDAGLLVPCGSGVDAPFTAQPFAGMEGWNYHFRMVTDRRRVTAYRRAIEAVVRPGMTVLEIGTGTGILAVMAARAGARVHAVERGDLVGMARRTVAESGVADRVTLHHADSRAVTLPVKADLLLSEMVGNHIVNEDLLELTLDARRRLLVPDAGAIPRALSILAYPVAFEAPARYRRVLREVEEETGVGLSSFYAWMAERLEDGGLIVEMDPGASTCRRLGEAVEVARIDLLAFEAAGIEARAVLPVAEAGELSGVLLAFELDMAEGVALDNRPDGPPTHWKNPLFPVPRPFPVSPGEAVPIVARYRTGCAFEVEVDRPGRPA